MAGSLGHISQKLAAHFPRLEFVVQDYEAICRQGEARLPVELKDRIRFQPHNMFELQRKNPAKRVVYFLRFILHDWSDEECCRILGAVLSGMKPGDRIVIQEHILPEPGTGSLFYEQLLRCVVFFYFLLLFFHFAPFFSNFLFPSLFILCTIIVKLTITVHSI